MGVRNDHLVFPPLINECRIFMLSTGAVRFLRSLWAKFILATFDGTITCSFSHASGMKSLETCMNAIYWGDNLSLLSICPCRDQMLLNNIGVCMYICIYIYIYICMHICISSVRTVVSTSNTVNDLLVRASFLCSARPAQLGNQQQQYHRCDWGVLGNSSQTYKKLTKYICDIKINLTVWQIELLSWYIKSNAISALIYLVKSVLVTVLQLQCFNLFNNPLLT